MCQIELSILPASSSGTKGVEMSKSIDSYLLEDLAEYELPDEGFGVVEIVETDERDEPLTGTAGIE